MTDYLRLSLSKHAPSVGVRQSFYMLDDRLTNMLRQNRSPHELSPFDSSVGCTISLHDADPTYITAVFDRASDPSISEAVVLVTK